MNSLLIAAGFTVVYTTLTMKITMKPGTTGKTALAGLIFFKVIPLFAGVYVTLIGLGV